MNHAYIPNLWHQGRNINFPSISHGHLLFADTFPSIFAPFVQLLRIFERFPYVWKKKKNHFQLLNHFRFEFLGLKRANDNRKRGDICESRLLTVSVIVFPRVCFTLWSALGSRQIGKIGWRGRTQSQTSHDVNVPPVLWSSKLALVTVKVGAWTR